jgi:hypothetical protein
MVETIAQAIQSLKHDISDAAGSPNNNEKWQHVFQELRTDLQNFKGNDAKVLALATGQALKDAGLIEKSDIIRGIGVSKDEIMVYRTGMESKPGTVAEVTSHGVLHPFMVHTNEKSTTINHGGVEETNGAYYVWLNPYKPKA